MLMSEAQHPAVHMRWYILISMEPTNGDGHGMFCRKLVRYDKTVMLRGEIDRVKKKALQVENKKYSQRAWRYKDS